MAHHIVSSRLDGRAALHQALAEIDDTTPLWRRLDQLLGEARQLATSLTAAGTTTSIRVAAAAELHFAGDRGSAAGVASLVSPTILGADADTTRAVAYQLKELIDALPCGFRITSEWISLDPVAYTTSGQCPGLSAVRSRAASDIRAAVGGLCACEVGHE
jgi:hypothetical protein